MLDQFESKETFFHQKPKSSGKGFATPTYVFFFVQRKHPTGFTHQHNPRTFNGVSIFFFWHSPPKVFWPIEICGQPKSVCLKGFPKICELGDLHLEKFSHSQRYFFVKYAYVEFPIWETHGIARRLMKQNFRTRGILKVSCLWTQSYNLGFSITLS